MSGILFDQFEELFEHARHGGGTEAGIVTDFLVGLTHHRPTAACRSLCRSHHVIGLFSDSAPSIAALPRR